MVSASSNLSAYGPQVSSAVSAAAIRFSEVLIVLAAFAKSFRISQAITTENAS